YGDRAGEPTVRREQQPAGPVAGTGGGADQRGGGGGRFLHRDPAAGQFPAMGRRSGPVRRQRAAIAGGRAELRTGWAVSARYLRTDIWRKQQPRRLSVPRF